MYTYYIIQQIAVYSLCLVGRIFFRLLKSYAALGATKISFVFKISYLQNIFCTYILTSLKLHCQFNLSKSPKFIFALDPEII